MVRTLCFHRAEAKGSIPGQRTKIPQATRQAKKKKTREKRRKGEKGVLGENKIPFSPKEMVKSISNRQHTLCEDVCVR